MRYKVTLSYDGTQYVGWQSQLRHDSVQEQVEDALATITQTKINVCVAGRTDSKVHALGQVFHFDTEFDLPLWKWKRALNGHLPHDIHVISVEAVDQSFHARYQAHTKRYDYLINVGEFNPLLVHYAYQPIFKLDIEAMEKAASVLVGTHDFSSFNTTPFEVEANQVRTLHAIRFEREGDLVRIIYEGKGFLRYMVRMMTGALVEVGRGQLNAQDLEAMLVACDKEACRHNAPPQGLYLVKIEY